MSKKRVNSWILSVKYCKNGWFQTPKMAKIMKFRIRKSPISRISDTENHQFREFQTPKIAKINKFWIRKMPNSQTKYFSYSLNFRTYRVKIPHCGSCEEATNATFMHIQCYNFDLKNWRVGCYLCQKLHSFQMVFEKFVTQLSIQDMHKILQLLLGLCTLSSRMKNELLSII